MEINIVLKNGHNHPSLLMYLNVCQDVVKSQCIDVCEYMINNYFLFIC